MARRRSSRGGITVRVEGIDLIRARLEALPEEIKAALRDAVRESAEAVRDETRQRVRVDTGHLRESVDIEYASDGLSARVGWRGTGDYYAQFQEFGTKSIPAQPALGPATELERSRFTARVRDEVRRALR